VVMKNLSGISDDAKVDLRGWDKGEEQAQMDEGLTPEQRELVDD
jgi:hypothetical protein